jgi:hypothetical protein
VKFSDLLGEPEPEETPATLPADPEGPPVQVNSITVFAPVPETDPTPPPADPEPPVPPLPASGDADPTLAVPAVPPPVNPPLDAVTPPLDAVTPSFDPVMPPLDRIDVPSEVVDGPPLDPDVAVVPGGRSDLASLNVHQPSPPPEPPRSSLVDQLAGLDEVVDDLLPPRRGRR